MGVQTEILTRQMSGKPASAVKYNGEPYGSDSDSGTLTLQGGVGALAIGKPGQVVARAFGPNVYALSFEEDKKFGTAVELPDRTYGVLVNSDDVAFTADKPNSFGYSDTLQAGQVGEVMTYGICVVQNGTEDEPKKYLEEVLAKMNARVLYEGSKLSEVELTGSKPAGEDSNS